ncbi:metallophosphoesterase 1 isoform X1 [Phyllopteryx taeniolatus]|uniref:metallophosphoesterase 1 isoform X1 n=1 Tax=Phyllopteryx taeniolatus TaxID=161469 RepID=UPI002AD2B244|nr:metallophosphoesterase 1 isoform X1 [Phyllopteryx taeniolatus]
MPWFGVRWLLAALLLLLLLGGAFFFCEYLIYFPVILKCEWPRVREHARGGGGEAIDGRPPDSPPVRAMVLSDTHLLGAVGGHWFDKLRREWQMERAFQTALWLLRPEVVFILGDIFDEGKWSSHKNWEDDVRRFNRIFRHSGDTELVVLVGNHDIGFHYEMDWFKLQRFEKVFNASSTRIVTKNGINFLLVNSVALHGDGCPICQSVEKELFRLSRGLNCSLQASRQHARTNKTKQIQQSKLMVLQSSGDGCEGTQMYPPTPPIMLQHYPLYRVSDAGCTGTDAAPAGQRHLLFREKYDVLSKEASQRLLQWFKPRLILSGHTHSGCEVLHDNKYPEVSVPSFNWRNRNNPSFILASVSPASYALSKCFLPEESTVISVYCSAGACLMLLVLAHCLWMKGLLQCLSLCLLGKHKPL